jgi:hypothetical protein
MEATCREMHPPGTHTPPTRARAHTYTNTHMAGSPVCLSPALLSVLLKDRKVCRLSPALLSVRLCARARDQRKRCIVNRCIVNRCIVNRCIVAVSTLPRFDPARRIGWALRCTRSAHPPGTRMSVESVPGGCMRVPGGCMQVPGGCIFRHESN